METEFATGAIRKDQDSFDPRDFKAEYIAGAITDDKLVDLPRSIDLLSEMQETYNQWSIGCCTATALCHTVLLMNIFDFKTNKLFLDQKYQRTNNQWKQRTPTETGDYLENALKGARKNGIKWTLKDWSDFSFKIDWYMFENMETDFERFLKIIAYNLKNKNPMYRSFRWNSKMSAEISAGNVTTVFTLWQATRWHATMLWKIDFDRRIVWFGNSRLRNTNNKDWLKQLSVFEISFDVFEQLCKNQIFNRRYRKVFDFKDIKPEQLFIDFAIDDENSEAYQAVKRAKDAWYIKGVPSTQGARLYPDRPMTRLEVILFLHRILSWK